MRERMRKLVATMAVLALAAVSVAAPAAFGDPKKPCNSGGGNGTESCNPGGSSDHGNPHDQRAG